MGKPRISMFQMGSRAIVIFLYGYVVLTLTSDRLAKNDSQRVKPLVFRGALCVLNCLQTETGRRIHAPACTHNRIRSPMLAASGT